MIPRSKDTRHSYSDYRDGRNRPSNEDAWSTNFIIKDVIEALIISALLIWWMLASEPDTDTRIDNIIEDHKHKMGQIDTDSLLTRSYERELLLDSIKADRMAHPERWDAEQVRLLDKIDQLQREHELNYRRAVEYIQAND